MPNFLKIWRVCFCRHGRTTSFFWIVWVTTIFLSWHCRNKAQDISIFRKRRILFFKARNQEVGFFVSFPDFCFSNRKACDLCSPENLSGDHREHRGKCENSGFSPALLMAQFSLKISPRNEKNDRMTGRRRINACRSSVSVFSIMWIFITQGGSIRHSNIGRRMKSISELAIGKQWDIVKQGSLHQSFNKSCPT